MKFVAYSPAFLPDLTKLVNRNMTRLMPGWRFYEAGVASILDDPLRAWNIHYPENSGIDKTHILCVFDQKRLLAAAQLLQPVGLQPVDHGKQPACGYLCWVLAEPDDEALHLLTEGVIAQSNAVGCHKIATTRFALGSGWPGIPVQWTHLIRALHEAGFSADERWTVLSGVTSKTEIKVPPEIVSMEVTWQVDELAKEWKLAVHTGEELVGECEVWGVPQHLCNDRENIDWVTIEWLCVQEAFRGRGIGRWLLQEQLRRQAGRGIRKAMLWTETENHPAMRLCETLGFRKRFDTLEFGYLMPNISSLRPR